MTKIIEKSSEIIKYVQDARRDGAIIAFVPTMGEIYPKGFATYIDQQDLPEKLCGAFRPGHFRGVMTVVAKLFNVVRPDIAYFGQKDYQQALIIRRMVTDLNFNILIKILPTIREEDGLAMSSRNVYLGPKQRKDATLIYKALKKADEIIANGDNSAPQEIKEMAKMRKQTKGG